MNTMIIEPAKCVLHCIGGFAAYYFGLVVLAYVAHTCSRIVRMVQDHYSISEEVLEHITISAVRPITQIYIDHNGTIHTFYDRSRPKSPKRYCQNKWTNTRRMFDVSRCS